MRQSFPGILVCLILQGCSSYSDFALPRPSGEPSIRTYRFEAESVPVLENGSSGEWDARDALNPSVVRLGGTLFNLYSGFDGRTWHTGLATSSDGRIWIKQGRVLSPAGAEGDYIAANGSALLFRGRCLYWYQTGPRDLPVIGLAESVDCRTWKKMPDPVMKTGPYMSWDERGIGDPYVVELDGRLYMFFLGQDRARRQRLGIAASEDGVRWTKLRDNPILELGEAGMFDENGLGEPAVWQAGGAWWMIYTGRDRGEMRRMGLAKSADGAHWTKLSDVFEGREAWNSRVICDATLLPGDNGEISVWYGGGDAASPDENLNGKIGAARLIPVRE